MGLTMYLQEGTGRATCQLCHKKIKKGSPCLVALGWQTSGQTHISPEDCSVIDNRVKETNWKQRLKE